MWHSFQPMKGCHLVVFQENAAFTHVDKDKLYSLTHGSAFRSLSFTHILFLITVFSGP